MYKALQWYSPESDEGARAPILPLFKGIFKNHGCGQSRFIPYLQRWRQKIEEGAQKPANRTGSKTAQ